MTNLDARGESAMPHDLTALEQRRSKRVLGFVILGRGKPQMLDGFFDSTHLAKFDCQIGVRASLRPPIQDGLPDRHARPILGIAFDGARGQAD